MEFSEFVDLIKDKKIINLPILDEKKPNDGFWIKARNVCSNSMFKSTVHFHDYFELELTVYGEATHLVNGKEVAMKKGYCSLMRKNDFHTFRFNEEDIFIYTINFYMNNISQAVYYKMLSYESFMQCYLDDKTFEKILSLCKILDDEFNNPSKEYKSIQKFLLDSIMLIFMSNINSDNVENVTNKNKLIQKTIYYIEENFLDSQLSLTTIADRLNVSKNYLGHIFKKTLGISFSDYVKNKRLDYSLELLDQNIMSINAVAAKSGFTSTAYFISQFKSLYNTTPKNYLDIKNKLDKG